MASGEGLTAVQGAAVDAPTPGGAATLAAVSGTDLIDIEVCYLAPGVQVLQSVTVPASISVREALTRSGVLSTHPEIDITTQKVGVYGKVRALDDPVRAGDRIEIYRPLMVDPKVARARRVAKTRRGGSREGRRWVVKEHR